MPRCVRACVASTTGGNVGCTTTACVVGTGNSAAGVEFTAINITCTVGSRKPGTVGSTGSVGLNSLSARSPVPTTSDGALPSKLPSVTLANPGTTACSHEV